MLFYLFILGKPKTSKHSFQYAMPAGFKTCADPNTTEECVPFRTIKLDSTTVIISASTFVGLVTCPNIFNRSEESLVSKLYFNVYQK